MSKAQKVMIGLLVFWMLLIFGTSCTVIHFDHFVKFVQGFGGGSSFNAWFNNFWLVSWYVVVKGWHATEYAILLCFCALMLRRVGRWSCRRSIGVAFVFAMLFAISDEWHQTFVPGRDGCVQDVFIRFWRSRYCLFLPVGAPSPSQDVAEENHINVNVRCLLCLTLLLLGGCGGGNDSTGSGAPRYRSLEFTLTTTKATFARGESVPLTFTVKNIGSQTVRVYGGGCEVWFSVTQGSQLIDTVGGCNQAGWSYAFAPGETKVWDTAWKQDDRYGIQVPPGNYTIKYWFPAGRIVEGFADINLTFAQSEQHLAAIPIQVIVQQP